MASKIATTNKSNQQPSNHFFIRSNETYPKTTNIPSTTLKIGIANQRKEATEFYTVFCTVSKEATKQSILSATNNRLPTTQNILVTTQNIFITARNILATAKDIFVTAKDILAIA